MKDISINFMKNYITSNKKKKSKCISCIESKLAMNQLIVNFQSHLGKIMIIYINKLLPMIYKTTLNKID